jgi:deazaflavin-dependent oxidoreductase (nitroreductase family)
MDIKAINRTVIEQFRAGSEVEGMDRREMILLTTEGARSGRPHTTPLGIIHREGERLLVVANNLGQQKHPDWYFNVQANNRVTVEADGETYEGLATQLPSDERHRVWRELEARSQYHVESQAKVTRIIPVVAITRLQAADAERPDPS